MPGVKTNERQGTRAVLRHSRMSASKARQVLDLIRGQDVTLAAEILANGEREASATIGKVLASAVANAVHNDGLDAEDLFVSACFADEGATLKRWRPRARGRATRIRKRTSHVTIIVSRMPDERIARRRVKQSAASGQRSRRVAGSRRRQQAATAARVREQAVDEELTTAEPDEAEAVDAGADEFETTEAGGSEDAAEATGGGQVETADGEIDGTDGGHAEEKGE